MTITYKNGHVQKSVECADANLPRLPGPIYDQRFHGGGFGLDGEVRFDMIYTVKTAEGNNPPEVEVIKRTYQ